MPEQQSVSCPVLETELHESEAELSVTSVTEGDAVGDYNSQLPSQHLAFINTNILSEANSPEARESIDGERTALQAASQTSDVVTSMHGSRSDSAQVERSLEEKVKEKTVSEASERRQDSDERWVVPHEESEEAQRVESIGKVGTDSGKQDDEAI